MTMREELYKQFGPMLLEAIVLIIKDEINELRTRAGLIPRTNQQMMDAIETKIKTMDLYDWIKI